MCTWIQKLNRSRVNRNPKQGASETDHGIKYDCFTWARQRNVLYLSVLCRYVWVWRLRTVGRMTSTPGSPPPSHTASQPRISLNGRQLLASRLTFLCSSISTTSSVSQSLYKNWKQLRRIGEKKTLRNVFLQICKSYQWIRIEAEAGGGGGSSEQSDWLLFPTVSYSLGCRSAGRPLLQSGLM